MFSIAQLLLVVNYVRAKRRTNTQPKALQDYPLVTVQLPVFNERYVIERLINTIAKLDYPKDKLEIQVLDDSTDETTTIAQKRITKLQAEGIDIKLVRRPNRKGYKAGALKYGLGLAKGEYITIFDADFVPESDFLKKTIAYFIGNPKLGVIQTRWGHLNRNYSYLTKLQAFGLDAHFTVEQVGRNSQNHFINFNGTGGVWRKTCILDAGNWEADTLTEDLDLSYRAQLKDWKFQYVEDIVAPAELPITMPALRSQQFRWMKGGAECTVKNLKRVYKSNKSLATKYFATMHLLNSTVLLAVLVSAILSVPALFIKQTLHAKWLFPLMGVFMSSLLILMINYYHAYFLEHKKNLSNHIRFPFVFFVFLSLSMGLSLHNSIAVVEGLVGKKSPFIRTPKFNLQGAQDSSWEKNVYRIKKISGFVYFELLLVIYFAYGIFQAYVLSDYSFVYYHVLLLFGFGSISIYSIKHSMVQD